MAPLRTGTGIGMTAKPLVNHGKVDLRIVSDLLRLTAEI